MTKFSISVIAVMFFILNVGNAQNVWDGSSISTQTGGKVAIGTSISNSYKLRLYSSNASDVNYNFYNYFRSDKNATSRGMYNYNYYSGTGSKYGIYNYTYNTSTGTTYGIYTRVSGSSSSTAKRYALYAQSTGLENRAGYFDGNAEVNGNFIIGGSKGKFVISNAWQNGEDFIVIAPNTSGSNTTWDWERGLKFENSGELEKTIDGADKIALSVILSGGGGKNFQVM